MTATEIQHYTSPSATTPSWTGELSANYTREIAGISGSLAAIQHNGETPVLQLTSLHGDIIATAADSETSTALSSTVAEASEYGVPATETPPKYSWLGAHEIPTTLPSGVMTMGARSYIPQLGRFLQSDPIPGGSANAYAYTYGDPVNSTDLSGEYTAELSSWAMAGAQNIANEGVAAARAAREAAARAEAEQKAREAAILAERYSGDRYGYSEGSSEEGPEEEWGEEEGEGSEEVAYKPGDHGKNAAHSPQPNQAEEGAVFFQELSGEENVSSEGRAITISRSLVHRCEREMGRKACMSYVGFFGWLKKQVKSGWHWIKKAAKSGWNAIKTSVVNTFHKLGYGDLVCYQTGCAGAVLSIWDAYRCADAGDCEAFSNDITEYFPAK